MPPPVVDLGHVLAEHGGKVPPPRSGWQTMLCPYHEDTVPSAGVNLERGVFVCHSCGVKGSAIALIRHHHGVGYGEACDLARTMYGGQDLPRSDVRGQRRFRPKGRNR